MRRDRKPPMESIHGPRMNFPREMEKVDKASVLAMWPLTAAAAVVDMAPQEFRFLREFRQTGRAHLDIMTKKYDVKSVAEREGEDSGEEGGRVQSVSPRWTWAASTKGLRHILRVLGGIALGENDVQVEINTNKNMRRNRICKFRLSGQLAAAGSVFQVVLLCVFLLNHQSKFPTHSTPNNPFSSFPAIFILL